MGSHKSHTCSISHRVYTTSSAARPNMSSPAVKLTYFDLRFRAEPARLMLAVGGVKYEDERIAAPFLGDPAPWAALKPNTPFGTLAVLEWDGETIGQSVAAARFIAKKVGLYGDNDIEAARIDEAVDVIQDLMNTGIRLYVAQDEEGQKVFGTETMPTALANLEKVVSARGGKYVTGTDKMSWADIQLYTYVSDLPPPAAGIIEKFPSLNNIFKKVGDVPAIKSWVETRSKTVM